MQETEDFKEVSCWQRKVIDLMEHLPPPSSVFHVRTGSQRNKDDEKYPLESSMAKNGICRKRKEKKTSRLLIKERVENDNELTEIEFNREKHFRILRWLSSIESTSNFSSTDGKKESQKVEIIDYRRRRVKGIGAEATGGS